MSKYPQAEPEALWLVAPSKVANHATKYAGIGIAIDFSISIPTAIPIPTPRKSR